MQGAYAKMMDGPLYASASWKAEPGRFTAYIAASSTDVRGRVQFELAE